MCVCVRQRGQLSVQDEEIRSLRTSLEEEQRRYTQLQQDTRTHTEQLQTHIQQLLLQRQEEQRDTQRLQVTHTHTPVHRLRYKGAEKKNTCVLMVLERASGVPEQTGGYRGGASESKQQGVQHRAPADPAVRQGKESYCI